MKKTNSLALLLLFTSLCFQVHAEEKIMLTVPIGNHTVPLMEVATSTDSNVLKIGVTFDTFSGRIKWESRDETTVPFELNGIDELDGAPVTVKCKESNGAYEITISSTSEKQLIARFFVDESDENILQSDDSVEIRGKTQIRIEKITRVKTNATKDPDSLWIRANPLEFSIKKL